jgi:hypothetical protein
VKSVLRNSRVKTAVSDNGFFSIEILTLERKIEVKKEVEREQKGIEKRGSPFVLKNITRAQPASAKSSTFPF